MQLRPLTREEVRAIDRRAADEFGMPTIVLMENAGRGAADVLERVHGDPPPPAARELSPSVLICAGKGNNAGDGFCMARHLDLRGYRVEVLLFADPAELAGDAAINYRIIESARITIESWAARDLSALPKRLAAAAWVVDALLGTGTRGKVRPPFDAIITKINEAGRPVLALDLPSGLDCDTGRPLGPTIRATHTVTFVAPKVGFAAPGADQYTGTVHVAGIGAPRRLLEPYSQP